jgi:hypothetical protein
MHILHRTRASVSGLLLAGLCWSCGPQPPAQEGFHFQLKLSATEREPHEAGIGMRLPDLSFEDLSGRAGSLSDFEAAAALLIVVRDVGCPVSKRYGPKLARLEQEFASRGVAFLYANQSAHDSLEEMRAEVVQYGFAGRYVHDPSHVLGLALAAETTTEVFLLDRQRTLLYRGAIDDQYGRGIVLPAAQREFLRDALEALLAGRDVDVPATSAPGCFLGLEREGSPATGTWTYADHVAPLVQLHCVECHRQGGPAPFTLETYEEVRGRQGMIRYMVTERLMPPWFASDECGPWRNDPRLPDDARNVLLSWIDRGMPPGDLTRAPQPIRWPEGWTIGSPDLVFQFPQPFEVPAEGIVPYMRFVAEEVVPEDLWVARMQILPGDPEVVHHATITFQPPGGPTEGGFREDLVGALVPWSRGFDGWRFLFGYIPGIGPCVYSDDTATFLPKGARIRFEMHYTSKGRLAHDLTRLGIVRAEHPPSLVAHTRVIRDFNIELAPGARDVLFECAYEMPHTALLRALTPHMHLRGRTFHADLVHPDGREEVLLRIPEWDPGWQLSYVFAEPVLAPSGSRIRIRGWYDNSAENPNNPDATAWVRDGQQILDEMFMIAVEWVRPRAAQ